MRHTNMIWVGRDTRWTGGGPPSHDPWVGLWANHPFTVGGTGIFLIGHGCLLPVTVVDDDGELLLKGPKACH